MIHRNWFDIKNHLISIATIVFILFTTFGIPLDKVNAQNEPIGQGSDVINRVEELELDSTPYLSEDGLTAYNAVPPLVLRDDPDPAMQGLRFPQSLEVQEAIANTSPAYSTFLITYVAAGEKDPGGAVCLEFPSEAKEAIDAAVAIWSRIIGSQVPITLSLCWSELPNPLDLGSSGWQPAHRDFEGAVISGVWYQGALANSLTGYDLAPSIFDDHITINSKIAWYYGTDANPPIDKYDLVTAALHEIAHGLNISGTANYSFPFGYWGREGYPLIFDMFMVDSTGRKLISYKTPSLKLGVLLTSKQLLFDGKKAVSANNGELVRMYAPVLWSDGSSYSHLNYNTFKTSENSLMVYALGKGTAQHNVGNVIKGILKDMGWSVGKLIGFNSQFNGSMAGWQALGTVPWTVNLSELYTTGLTDTWASVYYTKQEFLDFEYSARVKLINTVWQEGMGINFRMGSGLSNKQIWVPGYMFTFINGGYYAVHKSDGSLPYRLIQPWTYTAAIDKYDWNVLKVKAIGNTLYFYINGALIKTLTDDTLSKGYVGFSAFKYIEPIKVKVDWAKLYILPPTTIVADKVSPEQEALNQAALESGVNGSVDRYFGE